MSDHLATLSDALEARVRDGTGRVVGLEAGARQLTGVLWRPGVIVTSEQSLPRGDHATAILPGGGRIAATLAGRDPTTNVAVLRIADGATAPNGTAPNGAATNGMGPDAALPRGAGGVVIALGSDFRGGATARVGHLEMCGPAWDSQAGGRIDALLRVGLRLPPPAEGGPMIDARGHLLGMSTFGPRRAVLAIPSATIARVVEPLLAQGRVARGWLGVGLHPVALPRDLAAKTGVTSGLMVVSFAEGAPAAGVLLPGDILLAIGARAVVSPRDAAAALGAERVGAVVTLTILRAGETASPSVTIAARPA